MAKGKKRIKRTKFGKRAIKQAKSGTPGIGPGGRSSVRTATFDIPGPRGRTDVMVTATIRKTKTGLRQLSSRDAARVALETGDFVRVKGGKTQKAVKKARRKADKKSKRFSKRLGKVSSRRRKR